MPGHQAMSRVKAGLKRLWEKLRGRRESYRRREEARNSTIDWPDVGVSMRCIEKGLANLGVSTKGKRRQVTMREGKIALNWHLACVMMAFVSYTIWQNRPIWPIL